MSAMEQAELAQLRGIAQKRAMAMEVETWARLCACLAKGILGQAQFPMVSGHIAIKGTALKAAGNAWAISLRGAKVTEEGGDPNAAPIDVIVIEVKDRGETPTLVVANGKV